VPWAEGPYSRRWIIKAFFNTLKTCCGIENIRLKAADSLSHCIALACITAWRVVWMTMLRRAEPTGALIAVFTQTQLALRDITGGKPPSGWTRDINFY
jgi:hypothetical protein